MKIKYVDKTFRRETFALIDLVNGIIGEYEAAGFTLTLRQVYYQMVARGYIANRPEEYKRLGAIIKDAREAGHISWRAIEDRTRSVRSNSHWRDPAHIVNDAIRQYRIDRWEHQRYRPEVWIEKDALVGVVSGVCRELDISYFSCRGYTSASEMWEAGYGRFRTQIKGGQIPVIIHLGDHDPSGIDMTRDIISRLELFSGYPVMVQRIALNMEQIDDLNLPPNPMKITDSRSGGYMAVYGTDSWELDALEPQAMADMITAAVVSFRDEELWEEAVRTEEEGRRRLRQMIGRI